MKEKDDNLFYDISGITETSGIRERATVEYMNAALSREFSDIKISEVSINESGAFKNKAADFLAGIGGTTKIEGLPPYVSVKINHKTGKNEETIVIWSPLEWNERFVGCPGGGTSVGGERHYQSLYGGNHGRRSKNRRLGFRRKRKTRFRTD